MSVIKMIEKKAEEILGDLWGDNDSLKKLCFNEFKKLIKKILTQKLDYIILIDRKGTAVFRGFLRLLKETGELDDVKELPVILGSRVDGYYELDESCELCIFDDIVNRGRNVERIATNLHRRGIRTMYFSSLGYVSTLFDAAPEEKGEDVGKTYEKLSMTPDEKESDIKDKQYFYKFKTPFELPLIYTDELPLKKELTLSNAQSKILSKSFNKFLHYCGVPYTSYTSYSRISCPKDDAITPKGYRLLPYVVAACAEVNIDTKLYFKDVDSCYDNGFFKAFRVFHNSDTSECLIRPCIFLPSLTEPQVDSLLDELNFSVTSDVSFDRGAKKEDLDLGEEPDNAKYLYEYKLKNKLEIKTRLLISILTLAYGIDFIETAIKDERILCEAKTFFFKSFARVFEAEKYNEYSNKGKEFETEFKELIERLGKTTTIVKENKLFDFTDVGAYPAPAENLLLNYTNFKEEFNKAKCPLFLAGIIKKAPNGEFQTLQFVDDLINEIPFNTSDDLARFFSKLALKLDTIDNAHWDDEYLRDHKLPPIPLLETVKKVCEAHYVPELLFPLVMATFDACVEDGSLSDCVYAEKHCDAIWINEKEIGFEDSKLSIVPTFRVSYHYQHGELSCLENFKRFCLKFLTFVKEANKSLLCYSKAMEDDANLENVKKEFVEFFETKMIEEFKVHDFDIKKFMLQSGLSFIYTKDSSEIKSKLKKEDLEDSLTDDLFRKIDVKFQYSFSHPESYENTANRLSLLLSEWRQWLFKKYA